MLGFLANAAALLAGSLVLSLIHEAIAVPEEHSFSLPLANIVLVTGAGALLYLRWGWLASGGLLAAYGAFCVVGGLWDRRQFRKQK